MKWGNAVLSVNARRWGITGCARFAVCFAVIGALETCANAQLFSNLQALGTRLKAGDPAVLATPSPEGPKGIATADFDGDNHPDLAICNTDGTITVYFGSGNGQFSAPTHLQTGEQELRGIVCADFNGDGHPDIAVAGPYAASVFVLIYLGERTFDAPVVIHTWAGSRNVAV